LHGRCNCAAHGRILSPENLYYGDISTAEFDLAWREADRLIELISKNQLDVLALSNVHREMLLKQESQ
jgi:hypothetical protein